MRNIAFARAIFAESILRLMHIHANRVCIAYRVVIMNSNALYMSSIYCIALRLIFIDQLNIGRGRNSVKKCKMHTTPRSC